MDGIFVPGVTAPESPERCRFRQEAPFRAPFCPFYGTCKPRCPVVPMEAGEWVSVRDRLPPPDTAVLVTGGKSIYPAVYRTNAMYGNGWWKLNGKSHYCNPKYWMPLPPMP